MFVYIGAYTRAPQGGAEGIAGYRLDPGTGKLAHVQTLSSIANPSFLALDNQRRFLYAVNEVDGGQVSAFARDPETGELTSLNTRPSRGAGPCHVSLDPSGRFALVANYAGGTIAVLPIAADGSLEEASNVIRHQGSSVNPERQKEPHPHMILPTPDGRAVLVTDLGTDRVLVYRLDTEKATLTRDDGASVKARPGAGPRHVAFAPNGQTVYVINELDSTLTVYDFTTNGLQPRQTISSLPEDFTGENTCAHVVATSDGRFVYGSNRGHDSLAIWAVDATSGDLQTAGHVPTGGQTPRNFAIDPSGTWLLAANQASNTVVSFRRDPASGQLATPGTVTAIPTPVCVAICP